MLGSVFEEYLDFFRGQYGGDAVEDVLFMATTPDGGYYVRGGEYAFTEMTPLVSASADTAGISHRALLTAFGRHLAQRFHETDPEFFATHDNLFDLLAALDGKLHRRLRGLYPEKQPKVDLLERRDQALRLSYEHCRRLEYVATGMIQGAARQFGEKVSVTTSRRDEGERRSIIFDVARRCAA